MSDKLEIEDILSHAPDDFNDAIKLYVTDHVLLRSRYLFVRREKGVRKGYCTHCRQERTYDDYVKHGHKIVCSNCMSVCIMKQSGRGRKYLIDDGYFVWFSKSIKDPNKITARGVYVQRNYSGDYEKVKTDYVTTAVYVFGGGESKMITRDYWGYQLRPHRSWSLRNKVFSERTGVMASKFCFISIESIEDAVAGTPFQYSTWEHYKDSDLLLLFDVAAKYPCVEYLTKLGLSAIVRAKIWGNRTYSAINWRAKTITAVLKITKQELNEIRAADLYMDPFRLWLFQQFKKEGVKISIKEVSAFSKLCEGEHCYDDLQIIRKFTGLGKIRNYVVKQFRSEQNSKRQRYWTGARILISWRDYLQQCRQLGMDLTDESVLYPSDLHRAHQQTTAKVKIRADESLDKQIEYRLPLLAKYEFESNGLFIRAAKSSKELIEEGNALKHCVGNYTRKYGTGKTDLFVIRRKDKPDKPYYTLEVINGRVTQVYGLKNCHPTKKVQSFVDAFKATKLKKSVREGVAV